MFFTMSHPPECESLPGEQLPLSPAIRTCLTIGIVVYLAIVVLGPMSNPVGSENLTIPLAKKIRLVHQALFLGHGYRFFGPDPGPSHILEYRIGNGNENETAVVSRFPDRDQHWPRLLYHRWFMLSETLYRECSTIPDTEEHRQWLATTTQEIEFYREKGELPTMRQLVLQRDVRVRDYELAKQRKDQLIQAVAQQLLQRHSGKSIELFLVERLIPRPVDVQSGVRLSDPRFLSEPRSIGRFSVDDFPSPGDSP